MTTQNTTETTYEKMYVCGSTIRLTMRKVRELLGPDKLRIIKADLDDNTVTKFMEDNGTVGMEVEFAVYMDDGLPTHVITLRSKDNNLLVISD